MKYGYKITVNMCKVEPCFNDGDIITFVIYSNKDIDTITEADRTMEYLTSKLNINPTFYVKSKEILVKDEHNDALINIKTDDITPELEKHKYSILQKLMKTCGRSTD